jgi:hypothetical protein
MRINDLEGENEVGVLYEEAAEGAAASPLMGENFFANLYRYPDEIFVWVGLVAGWQWRANMLEEFTERHFFFKIFETQESRFDCFCCIWCHDRADSLPFL